MIVLALELSSPHGSVALLRDATVLAQDSWSEKNVRSQHVFSVLPDLLKSAAIALEDVELFAVGRGPGSYSGTRVAITAARALALPGNRPVFALSSGEALAAEFAEQASHVVVLGDARRGKLWAGIFAGPEMTMPWSLLTPDELPAKIPAGAIALTSDAHRVFPMFGKSASEVFQSLENSHPPKAEFVGKVALRKLQAGITSESLTPIYMHPAV
jgi:tRNA threonylcarbamoyl adenosine modification protein YeaZ